MPRRFSNWTAQNSSRNRDMDLQDRVIGITREKDPLSRAIATAFGQEGATVEWVSEETDPADFARTHPKLDTLILSLPTFPAGETIKLEDSAWAHALDGILAHSIQLIQAAGARMVEQHRGCILILGSLAGTTGFPGWALASAVEGALVALTRALSCEWASSNVRVTFLACSPSEANGAAPNLFTERTPLGRTAQPDEIARVALYLASERASFTTGTVVHADGGWTAWGLLK